MYLKRFSTAAFWLRRMFVIIPLMVAFISFCRFHLDYLNVKAHGQGFWQLQRNWEDMQRYVKANTAKDALLMVPNNMEMGGFRILSERKLICCYRDCGIIGFDYKAALEWQRRLADIDAFRVFIKKSIGNAVVNAITKYKVNYIVFMRYAAPSENGILKKIYENEVFVLYKVVIN